VFGGPVRFTNREIGKSPAFYVAGLAWLDLGFLFRVVFLSAACNYRGLGFGGCGAPRSSLSATGFFLIMAPFSG